MEASPAEMTKPFEYSLKELKCSLNSIEKHIIDNVEEESPMQRFYRDKTVFLTGATGFFGKIIIEKLLRVTEVNQIFLLIRTKKGKDAGTRIDDIFSDPIFEKLKKCRPDFRQKITIISGDCSLSGLGISGHDAEMIKDYVNIVIHAAATVRFDEKLKLAIAINVNGTKEILKLAKGIVHLKAFVHVSTAFAHCNHRYIQERFYNSTITGDNAIKLSGFLDEHTLNELAPTIYKGYPNTYTFTKVLAENIVENYAGNMPITIFRPGIVITTYKEPVSGWIDNMYGPCGIIVGIGSGVLRVFSGKVNNKAHIVPVDLCVNALLTSAWDIARNSYESIPIYNYVPDPDNMVTWREYIEFGFQKGVTIPLSKSIWYPCFTLVPSVFMYKVLAFLYHTLPAMFIDLIMILTGRDPKMLKIYRKIHKLCSVMEYFSSNDFKFDNDNVRRLSGKLVGKDRELFTFDLRDMNWSYLFDVSFYGLRLYVVKDDPSSIPYSVKRYERLKILHYSTLFVLYSFIFYLFYRLFLCFF